MKKSDLAVVAAKPTNKAGRPVAEPVEPRARTKGNARQHRTRRAQDRESVTQALERVRLRLNAVRPGLTETGMLESFMQGAGNPDKLREAYRRAIPIGRLGKPGDISGAVVFFLNDDGEFNTGQVLSVSGGLTMHG
ncbi:SDR family oxidoreductase [Rhizobium leguminosarum]